jgi:AraC-like DNA-binding protein
MSIFSRVVGPGTLLILIFCFHLLTTKKGNRMLNGLLSIPLLSRAGQNIVFLLVNTDQLSNYPHLLNILNPLGFAAPACFYLYIDCYVKNKKSIKKIDLLHFIPAIFSLIDIIYSFYMPHANLVEAAIHISKNKVYISPVAVGFFPERVYYLGKHILFFIYLFLSWKVCLNSGMLKKTGGLARNWLLTCLITVGSFQTLGTIPVMVGVIFPSVAATQSFVLNYITVGCLMFFVFIVYIIHQPRIMYEYLIITANQTIQTINAEISGQSLNNSTAARLTISPDRSEELITAINDFMTKEQPYLDNRFQIINLANHLNIPLHHCSFIVNNIIGKNFRDWINSYRIKYFIENYIDEVKNKTIDGLAFDSGFNSITTFYRAFKKETGEMPLAYFRSKAKANLPD